MILVLIGSASASDIDANDTDILSASDDEVVSVENDLDELSTSGTFSGLSEEIGSGGNIELEHDYYTYDSGSTISISTPDSVINGKGAVIDMAGSTIRAFNVGTSGVTIKNLTIKNVNYTGNGGAIYFSSSGSVMNCNFINNSVSGDESCGGAVYFYSNGEVTNCNFTNNKASYGGAVYSYYRSTVTNCNFVNNTASISGGAVCFNSNGNVTYCNFTDNSASSGGGGAVSSLNNGEVTNCIFVDNFAPSGGAVYFYKNGNVTDCNFTNNKATRDFSHGGAVHFNNVGTAANCNFVNNSAPMGGAVSISNGDVTDCNFVNNTAQFNGGAIEVGTGNVTDCNFTDNSVSGGYMNCGGAIYITNGDVTDCNFINSQAIGFESYGGAIYFDGNGAVTNCNFNRSSSKSGGAVIFNSNGTITNCNFTNNSASNSAGAVSFGSNGNVTDCNFADNSAMYSGAVSFKSGAVTNSNFTDNSASISGGALSFSGNGSVTNCSFTNNQGTSEEESRGGAVYFSGNGDITNCSFTNNAARFGGAIYFAGTGNVTICNFANNQASIEDGNSIYWNAPDGRVDKSTFTYTHVLGSEAYFDEYNCENVTVSNSRFVNAMTNDEATTVLGANITNCTLNGVLIGSAPAVKTFADIQALIDAAGAGDTIVLSGEYFGNGSVITVDKRLTIDGNGSVLNGGNSSHIFVVSGDNVVLKNMSMVNVNASIIGGAVVWDGGVNGSVVSCVFENCSSGTGGAISWSGDNGSLVNCVFVNCSSGNFGRGGAVFWSSGVNCSISDCSFRDCYCGDGGGAIHLYSGDGGSVAGCSFLNCTSNNGGAIFWKGNDGVFSDCRFDDCLGRNNDGGISLSGAANAFLINCSFNNCTSYYRSGAVSSTGGNASLVNCSFVNCSADVWAGAVDLESDNCSLINCSFESCHANYESGAVHLQGFNCSISGCHFANCSVSPGGTAGAISWNGDGIISDCSFENCSGQSNSINWIVANGKLENSTFKCSGVGGVEVYIGAQFDVANVTVSNCRFENANTDDISTTVSGGTVVNCTLNGVPIVFPPVVKSFADIQTLIDEAGDGDTIMLSGEYVGSGTGISVDKQLTIDGNGAVLDAKGMSGIFDVSEGGVILMNMNLINGLSDEDEAVLCWAGSNGTIFNCSFVNCSTTYVDEICSDFIKFDGPYGLILNCSFEDCEGSFSWGASAYYGSLVNCSFTNLAGYVYWQCDDGSLVNCSFVKCSYPGMGTVLWDAPNGTVSGCSFVNCSSYQGEAGAIWWRSDDGAVLNCSFENCFVESIDSDSKMANSIYWDGSNGIIDRSRFIYFHVDGQEVYIDETDVTVSNSRFENINTDDANTTVQNGVIVNCTLNGVPIGAPAPDANTFASIQALVDVADVGSTIVLSGIYTGNGKKVNVNKTLTIDGNGSVLDAKGMSGIFDVRADGVVIKNIMFLNGLSSGSDGEVISWYDSNGIMLNCSFINCSSNFVPGVGFNPIVWIGGDNCSIINSIFVNCPVNMGGAVRWTGTGGSVVNCSFDNCSGESGYSIYWKANNGKISDSSFIYYAVNGVEVKIEANNVTVSNSRFKSSNGDSSTSPVLGGIIVNCTFVGTSLWNPEMTISASDIFLGENETIIVNLKGDADGEVTFTLYEGDKFLATQTSDIIEGVAGCGISDLALGVYRIEAEYSGDSNYNSSSAAAIFIVRPYANITQDAVVGDTVEIAMDLENASDYDRIKVFVDGIESAFGYVISGSFLSSLPTGAFSYGSHAVTFQYLGNAIDANVFNRWDNRTNTFVPYEYEMNLAPIEAIETPDVVDSDDSGIIILRVSDSNSSGTVNVRIYLEGYAGVYKEFIVDVVNGIARIDVSGCKDGSYRIVVTYSGDSKHAGFTKESVAVVHNNNPSAILANDASIVYTSNEEYYAIVLTKTGKGVAGVSVSFYLNGKYYSSAVTNANGVAGIRISKAPGTYKVTSSVGTLSITKTLKVTHLLSLKKVSVKKSAKKLVLTATLKKVNGKYLKNKKITFKFKGKKYTAKTNKKGVAKFTIKSKVLKKLKTGKKVTYQATYLKDTVKYSVKIKK